MNRMNKYNVIDVTENYILIEDSGEGISITNSAEEVLEDLYKQKIASKDLNQRIFYIDTEGQVDELEHILDNFISFRVGFINVDEFYKNFKKMDKKLITISSNHVLTLLKLLMQEYLVTMDERNEKCTMDWNKVDTAREYMVLNNFFLFVKNESKYNKKDSENNTIN